MDASGTRRVGIVCESVSCLDPAAVGRLGVQVVPVPFIIDGKTYFDGVDLSADEFYAHLVRTGKSPATSAPSPAAYMTLFRGMDADDIVCVTVSAAVSTIAERCRLAIDQARDELPDKRIELFDSGNAAMGQGFLVLAAARVAERGGTFEEALQLLKRKRKAAHVLIVLDTLKYLAQTGRLQSIGVMAGNFLSIKPVVHINDDSFSPVEICRTRRRGVDRMLERLLQRPESALPREVAVQHAAAPEEAERLGGEVLRRLPSAKVSVVPFSPVMGTYAGPGLVGLAWLDAEP